MTQIPSGWYPDPTPAQPVLGPSLRWWDGAQWTEHVAVPPPMTQPAYPAYPAQHYPTQPYPTQPTQPYPTQGYAGAKAPATTPDGQPLSGWWRRVGAAVIDFMILLPIAAVVGLPFLIPMTRVIADEWDKFVDEINSGSSNPQAFSSGFQSEIMWYALGYGLVSLAVAAVYEIGFLRWKLATPGKMALGVQVRLRERPGTMPWGSLFLRFFVKKLGGILGLIPFVGGFLQLPWLINFLWPLWDDKKQALHDKAAKTNVVRVR